MDSNEKEIRFNQTEYDRIINRHGNAINALQKQIQNIQLNGLAVTSEDLFDVVNHGNRLYEQAEKLARTEAQRVHRIPAAQDAFFFETLSALSGVVTNFRNELRRVLLVDSQFGSLETDAFEIKTASVSLSKQWKERLRDRLTTYETPDREEALRGAIAEAEKLAHLEAMTETTLVATKAGRKTIEAEIQNQDQEKIFHLIQ